MLRTSTLYRELRIICLKMKNASNEPGSRQSAARRRELQIILDFAGKSSKIDIII